MKRLLMVMIVVFTVPTLARALPQTATGFYYPTGSKNWGSYAGFLAIPPTYTTGYCHLGKDVSADFGDAVYAIADGTVYYVSLGAWSIICDVGQNDNCCNSGHSDFCNVCLVVQHKLSDGTKFLAFYGHVQSSLSKGDVVYAGEQIATIGHWYGGSDHLHFGIHPEVKLPTYFGRVPISDPPPDPLPTDGFVAPINYIETHAPLGSPTPPPPAPPVVFTERWVTQSPFTIVMQRGQQETFTVRYKNTGNQTWKGSGYSSSDPNYVELRATNQSGNGEDSWLHPTSGWISAQRVVKPNEATILPSTPGQSYYANFSFTVRVPDNYPSGTYRQYFRMYNTSEGYLSTPEGYYEGYYVEVTVIDPPRPPVTPNAYADVAVLYNYGSCQTRAHMLLSNTTGFVYQGDNGWRILNDYCLQYVIRSLAGDFDGNGVADIATVYQYGACQVGIHVLLSTGVAFDYEPYWWQSTGYCVSLIHGMAAGDFNADGKDDIAVLYDYGSCDSRLHVMLSTGVGFLSSPAEGWWRGNGWYCASSVKFMAAGDITGDGKDDIVLAYRYGASNTSFHTFLSTGSSFTYQSTWWSADYYSLDAVKFLEMGDLNADGKADVVTAYRYGPSNTSLHTFLSTGSSFTYQSNWWSADYYSLDAVPYMQVGDITGEGRADVAMAYRYGEYNSAIHCFTSSGTAFTYQPFWWQHTAYGWDFTNTFLVAKFDWNGGSPKVLAEEPHGSVPLNFALNQNYPNPFNPVTVIAYSLPAASHVTLDVFNILGQKVATLVDEPQTAGDHQVTWDATQHSSGVYLYRIQAGEALETKKMLFLK